MASLYAHLPFCRKRCPYCDFYSNDYSNISIPENEYFQALIKNIEWWKNNYKADKLSEIYFGGGTPSLLSADFFKRLIDVFYDKFGIKDDAEISIEVNPESLSKKWINDVNKAGFNRITIGVQTFQPELLKIIGREYDSETALKAIAECQDSFNNVGVDLMFGIPTETKKQLEEDLQYVLTMNPKHISFYNLTITPLNGFWNGHKILSEEDVLNHFRIVRRVLNKSGWKQYEISNYAKNGYECRHHMNCWGYGDYMGIGSGAVSFVKKKEGEFFAKRWKVVADVDKYLKSPLEIVENDLIDIKSAMNEYIMLSLRTKNGVLLDQFYDIFKMKFDDVFSNVSEFVEEGFIVSSNNSFYLTDKGQEMLNSVVLKLCR